MSAYRAQRPEQPGHPAGNSSNSRNPPQSRPVYRTEGRRFWQEAKLDILLAADLSRRRGRSGPKSFAQIASPPETRLPGISFPVNREFQEVFSMRNIAAALGLAALLLATQTVLSAQSPGPGFAGRGFGHDFAGGHFGMGHVVTGEPYSGVRTSTFVETLANGGTITHTTTTNEARDSSGRIYRATQFGATSGQGAGSGRTEYTVFDPVGRTVTNWRSGSTQAFLMHLPTHATNGGSTGGPNGGPHPEWHGAANGGDPATEAEGPHHHGPAPTVTQLGTRSFEVVNGTGTRTTVTFPAGSFGNSQAITVTHERWVSDELGGLVVSETDNDPRDGVHTTTLTNIQRSEPDASLFQPPQGYTVTERTGGHRF
jgi:hypothetical protein